MFKATKGNTMSIDIEQVVDGYIDAALWADCLCACDSGDCDCESGGRNHLEVSDDDRQYITIMCGLFIERNRADCEAFIEQHGDWNGPADSLGRNHYSASECLGHDLRMTSGGHGVGFWDRGLGDVGDSLTEACGLRTVFSRECAADVWDGGDGRARFDHYDLTTKV